MNSDKLVKEIERLEKDASIHLDYFFNVTGLIPQFRVQIDENGTHLIVDSLNKIEDLEVTHET